MIGTKHLYFLDHRLKTTVVTSAISYNLNNSNNIRIHRTFDRSMNSSLYNSSDMTLGPTVLEHPHYLVQFKVQYETYKK